MSMLPADAHRILWEAKAEPLPQVLLYIGGSKRAFVCQCKANVFTKLDDIHFKCNGCELIYESE